MLWQPVIFHNKKPLCMCVTLCISRIMFNCYFFLFEAFTWREIQGYTAVDKIAYILNDWAVKSNKLSAAHQPLAGNRWQTAEYKKVFLLDEKQSGAPRKAHWWNSIVSSQQHWAHQLNYLSLSCSLSLTSLFER